MFLGDFGGGNEDLGLGGVVISEYIDEVDGGYARGPERALLAAILFDGVQSYMNYISAGNSAGRNRYREAYNWVNKKGDDYVFSFDSVCEALGVNSEYFRLGLLNATNSMEGEYKKTRRNF